MRTFTCRSCRRTVPADPRVKNQQYCGRSACQRVRRRRWQRTKMATDPDYRDNQLRAQQDWRARNPDYWRQRRQAARADPPPGTPHSSHSSSDRQSSRKMDTLQENFYLPAGSYVITPIGTAGRKMDPLRVEILPLSRRYESRKKDSIAFADETFYDSGQPVLHCPSRRDVQGAASPRLAALQGRLPP